MLSEIIRLIIKTGILVVWWRIGTEFKKHENNNMYHSLKAYAKKVNKPFLNLGCGKTNFGDVNADIIKRKTTKNYIYADANTKLPFKDKQFAVCFASNMIEHLHNPVFSLREMQRVADKVYLGHPHWWQLGTWLTPDHRWLVFNRRSWYLFKKQEGYRFVKYNPVWVYIMVGIYAGFL